MRPLGPVPLTCAIVTPNSRANLRTDGLAWLAPSIERTGSARTGVTAGIAAGGGVGVDATGAGATGDTCAAGAAEGAGADALASLASNKSTTPPSEILSPTLTLTSFTTPACEDGTSMVALSDSSVIRDCSFSTRSPGLICTSMTGTS